RHLLEVGKSVEVPTWQALDVRDKPQGNTFEVCDVTFYGNIPDAVGALQYECTPHLPWAENQFKERVAGPANPGETYKEWPWAKASEEHKPQGRFSHTYMDRYWPTPENNPPVHLASC